MSCKCYNCQRTYDDYNVTLLYICYICEKIICGNCKHHHNLINYDGESLLHVVKTKGKLTHDNCVKLFNFNEFGYPHDVGYTSIDFTQVEINREILKPYRFIQFLGMSDYKLFDKDIMQIKRKFMYQLNKLILSKRFCEDITQCIADFL